LHGWLLLLAAAHLGCQASERVSVSGHVTHVDGSPVAGSRVIFRSPTTGKSASGMTDEAGYYELGTIEQRDGIPPGEYAVAVTENRGDWDHPEPRTIHPKYQSTKTSGLSCEVEPGKDTTFDLTLEPPPHN
jgi:protocatechuate 3,4-dioxygenase beta subunit